MDAPVDLIRKQASLERGRHSFEHYGEGDPVDPISELRLKKMAHADLGLLGIAAWCTKGDALDLYEIMGGEFTC